MDPIGPDVPSSSRRVRLAMTQNRVADHDLKVALHRMEEERLRASQSHNTQRLKLLDDISTSTASTTPDNEEPRRITPSRGTGRKVTGEGHPARLLSREEVSGPPRVHFEDCSHGRSDTYESVKVDHLITGSHQEGRRRYTMGMTKSDISARQNCLLHRRRRSVSLNDADLRGIMARKKPNSEGVVETEVPKSSAINSDNIKPVARPQSAMASTAASLGEKGRSFSVDLHDIFKTAKRNGVLEPISPRHGTNGCPSVTASHHLDSRAYVKRHSEPHVVFTSRSILPMSPLSITSSDNYSSVNSSDDSDTSPEADENQFPLQPYSIGNLCVRDSKGAFEQKTGMGGLRAWTGLSPKPKSRRVLHQ